MSQVFIVGTGRCGSTMLSNFINSNTELLSLSEYFVFCSDLGTTFQECFDNDIVSAKEAWEIIGGQREVQNFMLKENIEMKEVLYPISSGSYTRETGVPALLQTTLPHLTPDFESVYNKLKQDVLDQPDNTMIGFHSFVMEQLKTYFDKKICVERSGGSLRILKRLHDNFPEAKFVHIVRDGRECALSMDNHYGFRMVTIVNQLIEILGVDPFRNDDREWIDDVPDELISLLPENFDREEFINYAISPSVYGMYWSGEIMEGLKEWEPIPEENKLVLQYEKILQHPEEELQKLVSFIGKENFGLNWIDEVKAQIVLPNSRFDTLSELEQDRLNKACEAGFAALQNVGVHYEDKTEI